MCFLAQKPLPSLQKAYGFILDFKIPFRNVAVFFLVLGYYPHPDAMNAIELMDDEGGLVVGRGTKDLRRETSIMIPELCPTTFSKCVCDK